jgi:hypothetical protein
MRITIWTIIAAVSILATSVGSLAQETKITDIELRAAYCLGVATAQYEKNQLDKSKVQPGPGDPRGFVFAEIDKNISERRDRFKDYLNIKGFLSGRTIRAIQVPLQRGTTDATQCINDNEDPYFKRCRKQCADYPDDFLRWQKECDAKYLSSVACTRVKRCLEDFLPF